MHGMPLVAVVAAVEVEVALVVVVDHNNQTRSVVR